MSMILKQSYKYGSSSEFTFSVEELQSGISLFSLKQGIGGVDFMPADGDTITVYSNVIGTAGERDFRRTLNNGLYYLVSDDLLTDYDSVMDQATTIVIALAGGRYEGSFVYSNPNDFQYLYIISDYTNNLPSGSTIVHAFELGDNDVIDAPLPAGAGLVEFPYNATLGPIRIGIVYNDNLVYDTGVLAAGGAGTMSFVKTGTDADKAYIVVENDVAANSVTIDSDGVSLTLFYIDKSDGTLANVCAQIATDMIWHNGINALPVAGDIIYADSTGFTPYDGNNAYHVISTVVMGAPSPTSSYAAISPDGTVLSIGSCACSEVAVPVITQTDITVTQNQPFTIYVEATNNPNSWELVTICNEYNLDGGARGAVFSYTDCDAISRVATVGLGQGMNVCASIAPTVDTGTGTVTLVGPCQEKSLPVGITFKDGIISGEAKVSGRQTIELIASNCFGDSLNTTFDVIVESSVNLTPVAIDISEPSSTGASACLLTGVYELLYHNNKVTRYPDLNSVIYSDPKGVDRFVGGNLWYKISGSLYSIQVDSLGVVVDTHTC
jgi:hypothetical protein